MAFNLGGLTAYTKEEKDEFVIRALKTNKTANLVTIQPGIKTTDKMTIMDSTVVLQEGANCGFVSSGTTTLSQRPLTVADIKVMEKFCTKDLEAYWLQTKMQPGSDADNMEEMVRDTIIERKISGVAEANGKIMWQGDTGSGDANLAHFDGYLEIVKDAVALADANSPVNGNPDSILVATGITLANVEAIVDKQIELIPENILSRPDLFVGVNWRVFRLYIAALKNANYFHYVASSEDIQNGSITIPGTNIKLEALHGLTGVDKIVTSYWGNMYMGTDLTNEEEDVNLYYSADNEEHRLTIRYKIGVNIMFTNEVVSFVLA
jgi:hypothetical protein